jgi:hypothetical protein
MTLPPIVDVMIHRTDEGIKQVIVGTLLAVSDNYAEIRTEHGDIRMELSELELRRLKPHVLSRVELVSVGGTGKFTMVVVHKP